MSSRRIATLTAFALAAGGLSLTPAAADAIDYTPIPHAQVSVVQFSSEEPAEAPNGAAALAVDGDPESYWHSK